MALRSNTRPHIGQMVDGYLIPVINERAVRGSAGILFLLGVISVASALMTDSVAPLQPFGMFFMIDMLLRLIAGDKWSPTLAIASLITRRQQPEWVGAPQKEFAWWLGFGLAVISCSSMGLFAAPLWLVLTLCSICLTLLFLETAFGICVGCALQAKFGKTPPMYCVGDSCAIGEPHEHHTVRELTPEP